MHKANCTRRLGGLCSGWGRGGVWEGWGVPTWPRSHEGVGGVGGADMAAAARAHEALSSFGGWVGRDRLGAAPRECREKR